MDVELPDGTVVQGVPDGTTRAQLAAKLKAGGREVPAAWMAETKPDAVSMALNKSGTATALDTGLALASGAVAAPVAGLAGLATTALKGPDAGADVVRKVQDKLTYEPRTEGGKGLVSAISYPFQKLADVSDAAGAKVAEGTGSPALGAGVNTALQSVPLVIGRVAPGNPAAAAAKANALKLKNAVPDAAMTSAKEAGYALPPSQANPSIGNKIAEGVAGKIKTAQELSIKDQGNTNRIVRADLGLAEDAPVTRETLAGIRKEAGQAYERVRSAGRVTSDPAYFQVLDQVAVPFERAAKDFPDAARTDILDAVKAARRESFDASSAVDQIGILRDKADTAYAAKDKKLGRAYKDIAGALEEQLARHIEETVSRAQSLGVPTALSADDVTAFRGARQTIAKSYTVEKHLQPNGDVDARGLAADLKRGKPLSGGLKTVAEFGTNYPKAAQLPEKIGGVPMSPFDHAFSLASLAGSVATGHPMAALVALAPYARPVARKILTSDAYQSRFVNPPQYGPGVMSRLQELQARPSLQALEMAEAQRQ